MVKKWFSLVLALLCLTGCVPVQQEELPVGEYGLWYAVDTNREDADSAAVVELELRSWENLPSAEKLLDDLLAGPTSPGLISPFPAGVTVLDLRAETESGTLYVNLSEQYGSLSGFALTVADYCIVSTMCQIPWVSSVRILVEGEPIPYRNRQNMKDTDLLLSGIETVPETFLAVLFFPDQEHLGLNVEYRQVERTGDYAAGVVMTELMRGPSGVNAAAALPEGTEVLGLSVNGVVCQVDLSSEFVSNALQDGLSPNVTLYALVNTLCALGGISQVRVLVEGALLQDYHGVAISNPLSADFSLVKEK